MRNVKRYSCLVLVAVLLLSVPVSAEETMPRASNYIRSYGAYLEPTSSTTFDVWFDVTGTRIMDELGTSVIKVQRSSDGVNWNTVRTYKKSMYPQMICENTSAHADYVSYTSVEPGFYYRAFVEFYAKNSSGTGYAYYYTARL